MYFIICHLALSFARNHFISGCSPRLSHSQSLAYFVVESHRHVHGIMVRSIRMLEIPLFVFISEKAQPFRRTLCGIHSPLRFSMVDR